MPRRSSQSAFTRQKSIRFSAGFTIVELLIVIVVIAILAAITIVAFNGIQDRARETSFKSDLSQADKQLKLFLASGSSGKYPSTVSTDCTASPDSDTNKCLKLSAGHTVESYSSPSPNDTYSLTITDADGKVSYVVTNSSGPALVTAPAFDGITIGSQTWATTNLNVGTMIAGTATPADNGTIEKYCYNDLEVKCATPTVRSLPGTKLCSITPPQAHKASARLGRTFRLITSGKPSK